MTKIKSRQLQGRDTVLLAFLAGLLGTCCLVGAILCLVNVVSLKADAQRAEATVTKVEKVWVTDDNPSTTAFKPYLDDVPFVRFQDGQRQVEVRVSNMHHPIGKFSVGQKVSVVYRTGRPEEAVIPSFVEFYMPPLVLGVIGSVFELVALAFFSSSRRKTSDAPIDNQQVG